MSRLSFKWRTILPVALALIVGIAIIVITVGFNTSAAFETNSEEWAEASVDKIANQCNAELTSMLATIRGLAPVLETAIADGTANRAVWIKTLQNIVENNTAIYAAHIYIEPNLFDGRDEDYRNVDHHDGTGVFAPFAYLYNGIANVRTEPLSVHQKYGYYQQVRSAGHEIITDPYVITDQSGQERVTATAALPIYVQGNFAGFIAADYYFDNMSTQLMQSIALGVDQSLVAVLGSNGLIAANKNAVNVNKNVAVLGTDAQNAFSNALSTKSSQFAFCNIPSLNDARCHVMFAPFEISATGTSYVAMIAADSGQVNAASNMGIMVTATLGTITLLIALAVLYFVVNNPSKAITALNEELLDSTDTILSASTQIAASSDILAQGGVQQAASIEETSATMSQTAVLVQSTTENTHKAVTLSSEATAAAEEGYRKVSDLVSSMEELSRSSDEISNIIKIIDDIAFQTNILALNAAVEAARAGDAGRGFAVVAEEIRTLALDSAEAASNTSSIIERNMELSRRGVDSSIEVGAALGNINTKNTEVNSLLEQVSNSSDEQARAAGQVNIALSQMEDVTQSNAAVAEESAAASSELKNQADALRQITEEMTEVILGAGSSPTRSVSNSSGPRRNLPFAPRHNSTDQSDFSSLPSPSSDDTTQGPRRSPQPQRRIVPPNEVIPLEKDNRF